MYLVSVLFPLYTGKGSYLWFDQIERNYSEPLQKSSIFEVLEISSIHIFAKQVLREQAPDDIFHKYMC